MYYKPGEREIEEICFDDDHIEKVLSEINCNFPRYFDLYLETEAGNKISEKEREKIAKELGRAKSLAPRKVINKGAVLERIFNEAVDDYENDRQKYTEFLDLEALEEYEDDPSNFKNSVLKNSCPIIRMTLQNKKAKELDKYRWSSSAQTQTIC